MSDALKPAHRAALDVAIEDLDAAAQPTKSEVFTACGVHAADLRDAIKAVLAISEEGPRAPAVARQDIIDAIHFAYASEGHIDVIADVAADRIMAMIPPVLPAVAGEVEGAVALIKAVRRMISEERKHAARAERGEDTTRDATDLAHADLMYFTVKDCDRAIAALQRPAVEGEAKPVAVIVKDRFGTVLEHLSEAPEGWSLVRTAAPPAKDVGEWVTSSRAVDAAVQELHRRRLSLVWADTQTVFDVVRSVLAEVKKAALPSPEGARADLMAALDGFADDYMTSEAHHPGYVLIPTAKFETIRAALTGEGK